MSDAIDLVNVSGRENMDLCDRIALLGADLMHEPFLGITSTTRASSQTIHDLKVTIASVRSVIAHYEERRSMGISDATLTPGARRFVAPVECMVLAWRRGGHAEYQRVRRAQIESRA